ncbi:hypothetical protein [Paenibacillus sp. CF384]|uniref:hypothetical protein n=1 Tax=Paenibacillus sp. CF384 TaxID=1884382 RepID=UPI0008956A77|nr:hypothetical protein [Paenibacillus sp. CF384]SDW79889.1 hypothetical protein SAMN05518855_1005153 [Paenibacillus sp. CF384]
MDDAITVKDLIAYLQKLPQDAELFAYNERGGFFSIDSPDDLATYFQMSEDGTVLNFDYGRYLADDSKRISEGKEWLDYYEPKDLKLALELVLEKRA